MTDKTVNYNEAQIAELVAGYDGTATDEARDAQIAQLADSVGKSAASVRAKLTHLGLYVPKAKAPAKKNAVRKAELVAKIAKALNMDEDAAGSLEKVTKVVLVKVLKAVS